MRKSFLVAQREILEAIKTKGFWIGILLFPVLFALSIGAPLMLEKVKSVRTYAVRDSSGWLSEAVERETAVADARRILIETASRQKLAKNVDALPPVLRDLAPVVAAFQPAQLDAAARTLAANDTIALATLPADARSAVLGARTGWKTWWDTATAQTVRPIASAASRSRFKRVDAGGDLNKRIASGELFAALEIGKDPVKDNTGFAYVARNIADQSLREFYERQATELVRKRRLESERISPQTAAWLSSEIKFPERTVSAGGEQTAVQMKDKLRQNSPIVFVYILWIAIFSITQGLLMSTIEEKSSRISEVLLSSVSPIQLMAGKIMGVAGSGLLMIFTWVGTAYAGTKYLPRMLGAPASFDLTPILSDPAFIAGFVVYFVLGYLLYAAILIGIGSVVNTIQEAQALMMPVLMTLMLPLVAMVPIARDPNGTFAKVMSFIPPFTPFVMMNRAAGPPTVLEYVLTTVLLVAAIAGALWGAAKIFRIGILMTGKPPRPSEILQWLRAPTGIIPGQRDS
jgi:ABC-2 type transport system permease protein